MTYAEPYVPVDPKLRRNAVIAMGVWSLIVWGFIAYIAFSHAISNADTRPDACAGLSAAECGEAVTK